MIHILPIFRAYALFAIAVVLAAVITKLLYNIFLHPLHQYPGPKSWTSTRLFWAHSMQSGTFHRDLHTLHQKYGPVVRIAPNELSFIGAQAWQDIFGTYHGKSVFQKNSVWAKQDPRETPMTIVSVDEAAHTRNRRALMGAFTEHAVREHAPLLEGLVGLMIEKFRERVEVAGGSAIVDIVQWLNFLTFDISGALAFGEPFDSVKNGKAHPWVAISCGFGKGIALMASIKFFSPLDKLLELAMPKNVLQKMQYHQDLARQKCLQRISMHDEKASTQDYVGSILQYNKEKGEVIPREEIVMNMGLLIFAGAETTSSALSSIIRQLVRNPEALKKAQVEIRGAFKTESDITVGNVAKLTYLNAVIQEGIRLGPPAAVGIPRVVPKEGASVCGRWVPGGTFVSVNQYPTFRSPTNFSRPDSFTPERFLAPLEGDNLASFEPFLYGRHKCLGQKLAMAEMRLILARIVYAFNLSAVGEVPDFGEQKTFIFWEKEKLEVELKAAGGDSGS